MGDKANAAQAHSRAAELATAELEHLGARFDAVDDAGTRVFTSQLTAKPLRAFSRGPTLLLGDIPALTPAMPELQSGGHGEPTGPNNVSPDIGSRDR